MTVASGSTRAFLEQSGLGPVHVFENKDQRGACRASGEIAASRPAKLVGDIAQVFGSSETGDDSESRRDESSVRTPTHVADRGYELGTRFRARVTGLDARASRATIARAATLSRDRG